MSMRLGEVQDPDRQTPRPLHLPLRVLSPTNGIGIWYFSDLSTFPNPCDRVLELLYVCVYHWMDAFSY